MTRAGTVHTCGCGCGRTATRTTRGLIRGCYERAVRAGTYERHPRRNRSRAETARAALELWERYGEPGWGSGSRRGRRPDFGITRAEVARELGISVAALDKALTQYRKQTGTGAPRSTVVQ